MTAFDILAALPTPVLVGIGGTLGALARYGVDLALSGGRRSTLAVNVLGSIALGALVAAPISSTAATVFGTGFCGAFTTFSSFAVSVAEDASDGQRWRAVQYAVGTLLAALVGVALGGGVVGML
ncbi:CrcB family protein [Halogeometricum borinquense]|uniref:Fluoride-specific ion channel FluC n=1 Tax=Halogeometricum borinquense TaxID=60847 RepID=A0A6C0UD41_9EURY|nr:CrcB family protein [Halogeometricum borinquense]QIB73060.1 CrcB family protein [Halogeometricum borinquense]QIQ77540.1 CrcB family protein [Halogeometricum borinquense]